MTFKNICGFWRIWKIWSHRIGLSVDSMCEGTKLGAGGWKAQDTCYLYGSQNPICSPLGRGHGSTRGGQEGRAQRQRIWGCIRICFGDLFGGCCLHFGPFPRNPRPGAALRPPQLPICTSRTVVLLNCPHQVSGSTPCSIPFVRESLSCSPPQDSGNMVTSHNRFRWSLLDI